MSTIAPLFERVILEKEHTDAVTKSSIIIPEQAKERPVIGKVLSVGQGKRLENGEFLPPVLKPGDRVLFGRYAGTELEHEGQKILLLLESDVLGVVSESPAPS